MKRYRKEARKTELEQQRNTLSDVALLVQRNEDLHNKCILENERLKLKVNRLLRKLRKLNGKKIEPS